MSTNCKQMSAKILTVRRSRDMIGADQWIQCPCCGKTRFFHLLPSTAGTDIPVYCRRCKKEILVTIID